MHQGAPGRVVRFPDAGYEAVPRHVERRVRDQDDDLGRAAPPAQLGAAQQNLARVMVVIVGFLEEASLSVLLF